MDGLKEKITLFLRQYRYVILIVAVGFVLMTLPTGKAESKNSEISIIQPESDAQTQLEQILTQIRGVGRVQVMLTVAAGEQTMYEFNEDRSDDTDGYSVRRETVIITNENRAQQGLIQQVIPPIYRGAIVVCQGGDQPSVQLAVVEAVSDVTGLTADKISVLKMK